jgi:iron complex transport system ATP-binding protein
MRFRASEKAAAKMVLEKLGIASLAGREYGALSSGEKRRFLIARALVHCPDVLVLDEASTALDFAAAATLMRSLRDLHSAGTTLVQVTHHPSEIPPEIDRVILLSGGEMVADGPKRRVLSAAALSRVFGISLDVSWHRGWCQVRAS